MWFLDRLVPGSPLYSVPWMVRFRGVLDVAALRAAVGEIVRRHEALRTRFEARDGVPEQVVDEGPAFEWRAGDLSGLAAAEREMALTALVDEAAVRPFDLAEGPVLRVRLARLGADEHVGIFAVHHIVFDAWSMTLFGSELDALYAAFRDGRPSPLPMPRTQYGEYASGQRRRLAGGELTAQFDYWRQRLDGVDGTVELPTDRPRPAVDAHRGAAVTIPLPAELILATKDLARAQRCTPFMFLYAAFALLLHRYSRQAELTVGVPVAGRTHPDTLDVIGLFTNTLVLRTRIEPTDTFRTLLRRVRGDVLGAFAHQDIPFDVVVKHQRTGRDLSRNPLFQHMFFIEDAATGWEAQTLPVASLEEVRTNTAKFDLTWNIRVDDAPAVRVEYASALFDRATVERMAGHYRTLLAGIVGDPDGPVRLLPMIDAGERERILTGFNDTAAPLAEDTLADLVEAQVARTPDAAAVTFAGVSLSYADFNARANQVAHRLRALGAGPDTIVAVCCERSHELAIALHGVVKAGAAYLPLDPGYPADRLSFMLADSAAELMLTQRHLSDRLPGTPSLLLDDPAEWAGQPTSNPVRNCTPEHAAYVIYTSGTTGRPKGVVNTHRGIVNRLHWGQREYRLTADDVMLQKTPASFDVSVWECFWPLICGARMVLAAPSGHADPAYLRDLIKAESVTVMHFVPSMLEMFLNVPDQLLRDSCTTVRQVFCGGEDLPVELANRCLAVLPARLDNLYGPTEAAVDVSAWRCDPDELALAGRVPIGRPIDNIRLLVLDADLQCVPIGVPGQLYIGGVGLARGYLRRPELTAEKFVPDPFQPGRLYATGDLVRWQPDGTIEFLGRIDHQVKVRGLRIELAEIESALRELPGVRQAVVVAHATETDKRLVGYVVGDADPATLRTALRDRLPEYMVPAVLVPLAALPLTPSGKVDRRALPAPSRRRSDDAVLVGPRDDLEAALARLWRDVLQLDVVGVHDDFFALGGHSLDVLRLAARLRSEQDHEISPAGLFAAPTIARLADALRAGRGAGSGTNGVVTTIRANRPGRPLYLVHPIGGSVLGYGALADHVPAHPLLGITARGLEDDHEPHRSIEAMADAYVAALPQGGGAMIAGWSMGGIVAIETARRLLDRGEPTPVVVLLDSWAPPHLRVPAADDEPAVLAMFAEHLGAGAGVDLGTDADLLRRHGFELIVDRAAAHGLIDEVGQSGQLRRRFKVFAAHVAALRDYEPGTRYPGPVTLIRAADRPAPGGDRTLGWSAYLTGFLTVHDVPGDHFSFLRAPNLSGTAAALNAALR